ncbi:MAG: hypothetical protein ABSE82_16150 [Nitrososphaerales archaeon]|jgi:hypothetical protein
MATHTQVQFQAIVDALNKEFGEWYTFQLVGSLKEKPASSHDADIVVYPKLPGGFDAFLSGCKAGGTEVVEIDRNSSTPFPGRPKGQDKVKLKFASGQILELFFPKGYCTVK